MYEGIIIEESLENKDVLKDVRIVSAKVEQVTEKHKTPWCSQWTLDKVEIPEENTEKIAVRISRSLDSQHSWYADFKNDVYHYIIFRNKIFKVLRTSKAEYDAAKEYGLSLGIPEYQVDFHPEVQTWER